MQGGNSKPDISGLQTQVLCHLFHCDDPLLARTQRKVGQRPRQRRQKAGALFHWRTSPILSRCHFLVGTSQLQITHTCPSIIMIKIINNYWKIEEELKIKWDCIEILNNFLNWFKHLYQVLAKKREGGLRHIVVLLYACFTVIIDWSS